MRVLITRPEREATALATALSQRGHAPVIAPLFRLEILHPPGDFAAALAACQAVLLTSANGARALAEASEQRSKPIFAVGDTTAATAEGLGFSAVTSAAGDGAALAELVRQRLDPKAGPLLHVSGVEVASTGELCARRLRGPPRRALRGARGRRTLPDSARAALEARALDVATFFSPRASALFARLVAGGRPGRQPAASSPAIAISPAPPSRSPPCRSRRRSRRRGPPARPCWMRSTACPRPAYKDPATMSDTPRPSSAAAHRRRRPCRSAAAWAWSAPS